MNKLTLSILLLAALACSQDHATQLGQSEHGLIKGTPESGAPAVFGVGLLTGGKLSTQGFCTATLVSPRHLLTAAHCVNAIAMQNDGCGARVAKPQTPANLVFTNQAVAPDAGDLFELHGEATFVPDESKQVLCGNDIALVRLDRDVKGVTPIAVSTETLPSVGDTFTVIGYGATCLEETCKNFGTKQKSAELSIAGFGTSATVTKNDFFTKAYAVGAGDSGGSAFAKDGTVSIGIVSRSDTSGDVYTATAAFGTWLKETIQRDAREHNESPPAWAKPPALADASAEGGAAAAPASETSSACSTSSAPTSPSPFVMLLLVAAAAWKVRRTFSA